MSFSVCVDNSKGHSCDGVAYLMCFPVQVLPSSSVGRWYVFKYIDLEKVCVRVSFENLTTMKVYVFGRVLPP